MHAGTLGVYLGIERSEFDDLCAKTPGCCLRERGAGQWEGVPRSSLEAAHPGALDDAALRPDGFEDARDVVARMRAAATELLGHNGVVIAVTHGAVLRLLEKDLTGTGSRFGHLEALVLGPGLVVIGRANFLYSEAQQ